MQGRVNVMLEHFKIFKKQINGNSIHKIRQKVLKKFFSQIIGGAMAPFGQGVATPMGYWYVFRLSVRIASFLVW